MEASSTFVTNPPGAAPSSGPDAWTVTQLDRAEDLLETVAWERLDPHPAYFRAVVESRPEVVAPWVVRLPEGDGDEVVFVGRLEDVPLPGSRYRPTVRAITLVHGGVAGVETPAAASALVEYVREALAAGEADVATFASLPVGSPLHRAVRAVPWPVRDHLPSSLPHWRLRLPETYEAFLRTRSKRTRENVKQYRNRLLRAHGDDLELRVLRRPDERDELIALLDEVASKTYQRTLGAGFADTPEQRALLDLELEQGWFRAYVLLIEGRPAAFWPGSAFRGTFFTGTPGYDPAYAELRIGTYVLLKAIEDLCADPSVDAIDYGFGDADYKRRFGTESQVEEDVLVFAPSLRGIRLNAVRGAVGTSVRVGRSAAARTGALQPLKRRWRKRLAGRATSPVG